MLNQKLLSDIILKIRNLYRLAKPRSYYVDKKYYEVEGQNIDIEYDIAYDDGYLDGQRGLLRNMTIYNSNFKFETEESRQEFKGFEQFCRDIIKKKVR